MANRQVKIRQGDVDKLLALYKSTYQKLSTEILTATDSGKIQKATVMARINRELTSMGVDVDKWVTTHIPQYYQDGANQALQDLRAGGFDLSRPGNTAVINKEAIKALTDETQAAFGTGINTMSKNASQLLGSAIKQQITMTIAEGKLSGESLKTISAGVRQALEEGGIAALTDKAGRNWTFDRYAEMLVRTKIVESRNQGMANTMLQNGYDLVQVSDHNSDHKACADWEGEILSLTGKTAGYSTLGEATADGLFHPNCEHAVNPIDLELAAKTNAYDNPYNFREPDDTGDSK